MSYKKIFWGFIFLIDLRINGVDLLPDIIGYILIFIGLGMLADRNDNFYKAKVIAFPLIFLAILDIYQINVSLDRAGTFGILISIITTIINLVMVYRICIGISQEANKVNDIELESKAIKSWKLYLIYNIIFLIMFIPGLMQIAFILVFILSIIAYVVILRLLNTASYRL